MANLLLVLATLLQAMAVAYGIVLLGRRQGAAAGWLFLLGAMTSMLVWRVFVMIGVQPPPYFNPLIAIWGSTCMGAAMYFFGREVARRRKAEAERDALLASERAARAIAERASRLKDDFLATASHELRTPLSVILSWCAILKTGRAAKPDGEKAIEVIERNARLQGRLVDDLLDMTRMQAGSLHLDASAVELGVPVRAALQSVAPSAQAKGVRLDSRIPSPTPVVWGDPARLQQIAGNLLTNAIKFTSAGGLITISVELVGEQVRLSVSDDGQGIDPDFLSRIFGRFQQADSSTTRRHGGLGLGLSIVDHLVRLHGGSVRAESPGPGKGATFVVDLPVVHDRPADAGIAAVAEATAGNLEGVRILLVDDERDVREATSALLEQIGARVQALESGRGIETQLANFKPQILVCDIGMPVEDGYSLIRRVRRLREQTAANIPAISLTAHAREEDRARALEAGFQDHLPKPIDVSRLAATIRRLINPTPYRAPTAHSALPQ